MNTFEEIFTSGQISTMDANCRNICETICSLTDEFRKLRELIETAKKEADAE